MQSSLYLDCCSGLCERNGKWSMWERGRYRCTCESLMHFWSSLSTLCIPFLLTTSATFAQLRFKVPQFVSNVASPPGRFQFSPWQAQWLAKFTASFAFTFCCWIFLCTVGPPAYEPSLGGELQICQMQRMQEWLHVDPWLQVSATGEIVSFWSSCRGSKS